MVDEQSSKEEEKAENKKIYLTDRVTAGGLVAVNVIILQVLISLPKLDGYLQNTAKAVAVALPLLIGSFFLHDYFIQLIPTEKIKFEYKGIKIAPIIQQLMENIIGIAGSIATLIGVGNAIYHLSPDAGQAFVTTIVIVFIFFLFPLVAIAYFREFLTHTNP